MKTTINYKTNSMGTLEHEGRTIELSEQAELTSRLLPYSGALNTGKLAEWAARGVDSDGRKVRVYWIHEDVDGVEPEDYNWTEVDRVEEG